MVFKLYSTSFSQIFMVLHWFQLVLHNLKSLSNFFSCQGNMETKLLLPQETVIFSVLGNPEAQHFWSNEAPAGKTTFLVTVQIHAVLKTSNGSKKVWTRIWTQTLIQLCQYEKPEHVSWFSHSSVSSPLGITLFSNTQENFQMFLDSGNFEQLNSIRAILVLTQVGDKRNSWYLNPQVASVCKSSFLKGIKKQLFPSHSL